jgi:hypothetical protein
MSWSERLGSLRKVSDEAAEANELRVFVVTRILRKARVAPRDYVNQARAIHQWAVENLYYVLEAGEYIQHPLDTIEHQLGDCDDFSVFLAAAAASIGLPYRFMLAGFHPNGQRWTSDSGVNMPGSPTHIFVDIGTPPECAADARGNVSCSIQFREADATADWEPFGSTSSRVVTSSARNHGWLAGAGRAPKGGNLFFLVAAMLLLAVAAYFGGKPVTMTQT